VSFWYGGGLLDDWSGLIEDDMWVVDLEEPTRKASMALVEVRKCSKDHGTDVGWVMCLRGASESNASLETTDSGADRLTKRLSSVREEDFGQKSHCFRTSSWIVPGLIQWQDIVLKWFTGQELKAVRQGINMHKSRRTWVCALYETANTVVYVQELDSGKGWLPVELHRPF
jgi:hypothetical protein